MARTNRDTDGLRIILADRRALWREALARAIERLDPSVRIREVDKVESILGGGRNGGSPDWEPNLVVLSIDPRDPNEIEALEQLCLRLEDVPVVVVADLDDLQHIVTVLERGAKGYIPTTLESRVMIEALRLVAAGGTYIPDSVMRLLDSYDRTRVSVDAARERLTQVFDDCTPRQRQVLDLLCEGKPNKLIAHRLNISENTVKAHLRQIMKRLNVTNRTEAVLLASGLLEPGSGNGSIQDRGIGDRYAGHPRIIA